MTSFGCDFQSLFYYYLSYLLFFFTSAVSYMPYVILLPY